MVNAGGVCPGSLSSFLPTSEEDFMGEEEFPKEGDFRVGGVWLGERRNVGRM